MEYVTKSTIVSHQVLNTDSGELEHRDFIEVQKTKQVRGGFNLMYHKSYEEVTEQVITSNADLRLFNWVTNQFTYKRVEVPLIYSQCTVQVSQPKFSKFIKRLIDVGYIRRIARGIYKLNPNIYVPFRADAAELQAEWNTDIITT